MVQKSISQSEISRFFRNKNTDSKTINKIQSEQKVKEVNLDASNDEIRSSVERRGHKRAMSSSQPNRFKVKKYVKKWDLGNPRYAADKAPS